MTECMQGMVSPQTASRRRVRRQDLGGTRSSGRLTLRRNTSRQRPQLAEEADGRMSLCGAGEQLAMAMRDMVRRRVVDSGPCSDLGDWGLETTGDGDDG